MLNRLIKNEVIDMADRVEFMQRTMEIQGQMLQEIREHQLKHQLSEYTSDFGEGEESAEETPFQVDSVFQKPTPQIPDHDHESSQLENSKTEKRETLKVSQGAENRNITFNDENFFT